NSDGWISVDEWHQYANSNVQIAAPAMKPEFYSVENGRKILLAKALIDDPKLKYRKEVENWIRRGEIAEAGHYVLEKLAESLLLTFEERAAIEAEALHPYQEYQEKLQRYEREFANVFRQNSPLGAPEREELKNLQQSLGLRDGDVAPLEELIAWKLTSISQSEEEVNEVAQWDIKSETNSLPSTLGTVLPDYAQIPAPVPINPTPAVNLSSSLAGSKVSPRSSSTSPKKSFLLIGGIGGSLAAMAVVIGMSSRAPIEPPPEDTVSSSPNPSPHPFPTVTSADKETSPSPIAPPETKECLVFVNGNLRSKPASFQADNVVATLREALPVTGKQTEGGWVEVKLSERKLAWVHRQIIANDEQMDACLSKKGIKIRKVEDIPPPPPSPNRSSEYRNSGVQNSL
ncbi:MAG: hypothetical protein LDL41_21200, partial [Coleofasciculus sp. S288]|nr:hypothetical protein [Coleofasciculus sp. S288]